MPIEVDREKDLGWPYESCYFCLKATKYWSVKKDIPVCRMCSQKYAEAQLPTKEEWCQRVKKARNYF